MHPPARAPLGSALALLIAVASLSGSASPALVAIAAAGVVVMVGIGWPELLELPSQRGTRVVVIGTGLLSVALAWFQPGHLSALQGIAMACAIGVLAAFGHQMLRPDRQELTASLTGTVAGGMLTGLAACWVHAQYLAVASPGYSGAVTAGALALSGALLVLAPPGPAVLRPLGAIVASTLIGALVLGVMAPHAALLGTAIGLMIGVGASAAQLLLSSLLTARAPVASLAVAAAPVATTGAVGLLAALLG